MRKREFDTDTAAQAIFETFWERGFAATSIQTLESATGLQRASLYAAFGPKRSMLDLSLDRYMETRIAKMLGIARSDGLAGIIRVFEMTLMGRRKFPEQSMRGCMVVNTGAEIGGTDQNAARRAREYRASFREAFSAALHAAHDRDEIDSDIDTKADALVSLMIGIFTSLRSRAGLDESEAMIGSAIALINSWRIGSRSSEESVAVPRG